MAEKHVHKVYGSFPPWGKSVEFPATGGGGGNYAYYSGTGNDFGEAAMLASVFKVNADSAVTFMPTGALMGMGSFNPEDIIGAGFDLSMKMTHFVSGELVTVGDLIAEPSKNWTQITEEEFYLINHFVIANGMLNASDDPFPITFKYDEGMTWEQWINSSYNAYGYFIEGQEVKGVFVRKTREGYPSSGNIAIYSESDGYIAVKPDDIIKSCIYEIFA